MIDLNKAMADLSKTRPVFHAEADFQHALAWHLRETGMVDDIRLEKPFVIDGKRCHIDLFARASGVWHAIELKYWTRRLDIEHDDDTYILANQAAQPLSRYDLWADVARMEGAVAEGDATTAWVITLTNDPMYWKTLRSGTVDEEMRLHEGRRVAGSVGWSSHVGTGTAKGREGRHDLRGSYELRWSPYSTVADGSNGEFRFLALRIGG